MQTIRRYGAMVRRTAGAVPVFLSATAFAQEAAPKAATADSLSLLQIGMMAGAGMLLLLLAVSAGLLFFYRARFLRYAAKCRMLEPDLEKTRCDLHEMTNRAELRERMIDGSGAAIFRLNAAGECIYVNPAMETLCGFSKQWIYSRGLIETVHPDDRAKVSEEWKTFAARHTFCESSYRLKRKDGQIVHVAGRGSTLLDKQCQVIGYSCVLTDVSDQERERAAARTAEQRSSLFIQQTTSAFYELRPDEPIPLDLPVDEVADLIYESVKLVSCSSGLAGLYGRSVEELTGSRLKDLPGGCGIFENPDRIRQFAADGCKASGVEVIRANCRGTPVCLRNDAVGMVEDGRLVSIWGAQQDISRQKRETEKMEHRIEFFRRILNALPGEVFVKDTRCRFLYVGHGFEERTGIPVDDWMEKTVFEVLPAAPRDFNKTSIQVMKSGKPGCMVDARREANGEKWIETLETPLISADGVVEGVVGLSVDITQQRILEKQLHDECDGLRGRLAEREAELTGTVEELEHRKAELEETLEARKAELEQESAQRRQLDEMLKQTREEFAAERDEFASESRQKVERLEAELKQLRDREGGLTMGCARLSSALSEVEEALRARTQELESRSSEWDARENELNRARRELEALAEQQARDLAQAAEQRQQLEVELEASRKEAAAGRETFRVQIERQTKPLNRELEELRAREAQLKAAQTEANRQLAELKEALSARTRELETEAAARKEEEQEFLETRRNLEDAAVKEKNKLVEQIKQFSEGKAKGRDTEKALRRKVAELMHENIQLELQIDQRTRKLTQAADQRVSLEARLADIQKEAARERETVEEKIEQKTQSLKQQLKAEIEKEERLNEEQTELVHRLAGLEKTLSERTAQVETLLKTRQDLEKMIAREKENLVQRIELFKDEMSESRKAGQVWQQRENELLEKIRQVETLLEQRTLDAAQAAGEREKAEQEMVRLNRAVEADHRMVDDLTEDFCEPLTPVLQLSESILKDAGLPEEARAQLVEVNRCARRLQAVLNYRLESTRLNDGVVRMQPAEFELNTFLTGLSGELSEKAEAGRLYFALSRTGDFPGTVCADQAKIRRILHVLFDHALEHTSRGQLGLHAICEESENGCKRVVFQLMYSGLEREVVMMNGLFDAIGQGRSCRDMNEEELQLDLARRYAQLLGGGLYLETRPERKPLLSFVLPIEHIPADDSALELPEAQCA